MTIDDAVRAAASAVRAGGVILYPTATVYGLGGDPTRPAVVERIRAIKGRSKNKPMLLVTDEWSRVLDWIEHVTPLHERLMSREPPLPVTILFDVRGDALRAVRGSSSRIGIRRTVDPLCRRVIQAADRALISTSANRSGQRAPDRFDRIEPEVLDAVDAAVEARQPLGGSPSTVVAFDDGQLQVLREGAISTSELRTIMEDNR